MKKKILKDGEILLKINVKEKKVILWEMALL